MSLAQLHAFGTLSATMYTSPNATYLPEPPTLSPDLHSIFDALQPRWAFDEFFYFAFIPQQPHYEGAILDCLSSHSTAIEAIERDKNSTLYGMAPEASQRWKALEQLVLHVQSMLFRRAGIVHLLTSTTPSPSTFGYAQQWTSHRRAQLSIRLSRVAFTLHFAFISYLVMKEQVRGLDTWTDLQHDRYGVPLIVCNAFRHSWISDWTVPRIGAFVDITTMLYPEGGSSWHSDIPHMLNLNNCIPLWFAYPTLKRSRVLLNEPARQICEDHFASKAWFNVLKHAVEKLYKEDNNINAESDNLPESHCYSHITLLKSPTPIPPFVEVRRRDGNAVLYEFRVLREGAVETRVDRRIPPTHGTVRAQSLWYRYRQLPGETYQTFMDREAETQRLLKETENEEERTARLARAESQSAQPIPTRHGPTVYVWIREHEAEIRVRVHPKAVPSLWHRTSPDQRVYNPFRNEYDVDDLIIMQHTNAAEELSQEGMVSVETSHPAVDRRQRSASPKANRSLARERSPSRHNFRRVDEYQAFRHARVYPKLPINKEVGQPYKSMNELLAELVTDDNAATTSTQYPISTDSTAEILAMRFGFRRPGRPWNIISRKASDWVAGNTNVLYRTMGTWTKEDSIAGDDLPAVADFVAHIADGIIPPADICDLHPDIDGTLDAPSVVGTDIQTLPVHDGSTQWYMVTIMDGRRAFTENSWRILVNSAVNTMHAVRAGFGPRPENLVMSLIARGIRLRIILPTPATTSSPVRSTAGNLIFDNAPIGLGLKPHGVALTMLDYQAYLNVRDETLQGPAGHAALLRGGIVWRMAWELHDVQATLHGPSMTIDETDDRTVRTILDGVNYAETVLNDQDMYTIAGVYRVLTPQAYKQGSICSWWPLQTTWEGSGYDVGYWSQDAEDFYQRRMKELISGSAKLKSQGEWKKDLSHTKKSASAFLANMERLSADVLYRSRNSI